jgi:hypothetical protein
MHRLVALSLAVALGAATKAAAAGDSEIEIANARQLAIQGIDAVESGNCKTGEPLLERAEKLHHATVHLQYIARCRLQGGRLVAATEMWRQIIREGAPAGSSPAVQSAVAEANSQLPHTLPRLASTTVRASSEYHDIKVRVDGVAVRPELLGAAQVIDPGDHRIEAEAPGFAHFSKNWTVGEGESAEVVITLVPAEAGEAEPSTGAGGAREEPAKKGSGLKTAGFIVGATGVIAMVAGTVTLLTRNNKQDTLASKCTLPNQGCAPGSFASDQELEDEKNSVHTLTAATNVLMFGGAALIAGGVTLIVIGASSNGTEPKTALTFGSPRADFGLSIRGTY